MMEKILRIFRKISRLEYYRQNTGMGTSFTLLERIPVSNNHSKRIHIIYSTLQQYSINDDIQSMTQTFKKEAKLSLSTTV